MPFHPPAEPKLYYITHIDNLRSIFSSGYLYSDARRIEMRIVSTNIGMEGVKKRRLEGHLFGCYPDTTVGQYVPFYFCPRSIMLYIIYMQNHPDLSYRGGQEPIVHLQIDMRRAIEWAEERETLWAFSDRNAAARVASFYNDLEQLNRVNWDAIVATDWKQPEIKEGKQAEFLVYDQIPCTLVEKIGVINQHRADQVAAILAQSHPIPIIEVTRNWYY